MSVNYEIKGMLARLLATEDLIVEHKKVETACFNVHTRVLTLPMWERASNTVYDLLCSHEAAHAIYTDNIDWTQDHNIPPQLVNVCEDARIEKLMKRRYVGLSKTFYNGYRELHEQDFFSIKDDDITTYNLADRVNLHYKVGNFLKIDFNSEEQEIVDMIGDAETFGETLIAAEALYKYCVKEEKEKTSIPELNSHQNQSPGAGSSSPEDNTGEEVESDENQPESSDQDQSGSESNEKQNQKPNQQVANDPQGGETFDPEVKTMESLEKSIKDLVNNSGYENAYIEIPKMNVKNVIIRNEEIHKRCKEEWNNFLERTEYTHEYTFSDVDKSFVEFKRSAQKEVNYLVKEFECRKAADSYARATTARTGVLDCSKLHNYKFSEDLFKKVTTLADGKNHGLVFVLDWSGSMGNVMLDTVKQLFNLVWFCKKVSIPFEVYAFTNDYPRVSYDENNRAILPEPAYEKKDGVFEIGPWYSLMNILTSKSRSAELEEQMRNLYRLAVSFSGNRYTHYPVPSGLGLSGTPLNETLISLHYILPQFQKENKLQKVQCVILTDGEAATLKYHKEFHRKYEDGPYLGTSYSSPNSFLRNRKTGNTYSLDVEYSSFTDVLLRDLRDSLPDINFIGIRVIESRDVGFFIRRYCGNYGEIYEKVMNSWKKEKSFSIKTSGYHTYFGISASALSQEVQFDVADDATKAQIKSAFMKSLRTKKMNKKVLNEFVELVA
jgi:hypothetical protein